MLFKIAREYKTQLNNFLEARRKNASSSAVVLCGLSRCLKEASTLSSFQTRVQTPVQKYVHQNGTVHCVNWMLVDESVELAVGRPLTEQ